MDGLPAYNTASLIAKASKLVSHILGGSGGRPEGRGGIVSVGYFDNLAYSGWFLQIAYTSYKTNTTFKLHKVLLRCDYLNAPQQYRYAAINFMFSFDDGMFLGGSSLLYNLSNAGELQPL